MTTSARAGLIALAALSLGIGLSACSSDTSGTASSASSSAAPSSSSSAQAAPQEVSIDLIPQPVFVLLDVSPSKARVTIGTGSDHAELVGSGTAGVIPGKRKVVARLEGYQTVTREVMIPVGNPFELTLRLEPLPAFLAYQQKFASKRWQAWTGLTISLVALSAVWPMIKWTEDSRKASNQWYRTSLEAQDAVSARLAAHSIKGAAGNVGGERLQRVAFELEQAAEAGDLHAARSYLADVEFQFELLRKALG